MQIIDVDLEGSSETPSSHFVRHSVRNCSEAHTFWRPTNKSNGSLENKGASVVLYVIIGPRDVPIGNYL